MRLTSQSKDEIKSEIEKPIKIEYQGKQGYFVTSNFMRDYISMSYEIDKLNELLEIKDNLYKSLYTEYQTYTKNQSRDKIISTAWRITSEVLGVSLLGVISGFCVYALVVR